MSGQWAFSFPWASSSSHQPNHRDDLGEDSLAIRPVFLFSLPLHPPSLFNPPPLLLVHRLIYRTRVKTIATHGGGWELKWGVGFIGITAFQSVSWTALKWKEVMPKPVTINSLRCPWWWCLSGHHQMSGDFWSQRGWMYIFCVFA